MQCVCKTFCVLFEHYSHFLSLNKINYITKSLSFDSGISQKPKDTFETLIVIHQLVVSSVFLRLDKNMN